MATLGLLQCDSLDPPHVDVDGDYDRLFADLLARDDDVDMAVYRAFEGELPSSPGDCDAWIVPGSRRSVYEDVGWITDLRRLVARMLADGTPLVGICFGHQMIAMELGARVERAECGWNVGAVRYDLHDPVPDGGDAALTLIASHQDQVLDLPDGATLLASAPTCPVAGFTVGDDVLCVQAHPEFTAALAGSLYRSRVDRIGAEPIARALDTLSRPLDRERVASWIVDFARGR